MQKKIARNIQKGRTRYDLLQNKSINRFWGNAARLEKVNVRNKNKGRKSN